MFQFQVYSGLPGHEQVKSIWTRIYQQLKRPCYYHDWRWHLAILQHLTQASPHTIVVFQHEQPIAIFPLQITVRRFGIMPVRYLHFLKHVAIDLSDGLISTPQCPAVFDALLNWLTTAAPFRWDVLKLEKFTSRSHTFRLIKNSRLQDLLLIQGSSAFAQASQGQPISQSLSKKQVKNVQRHIKQAEQTYGAVTYRCYDQAEVAAEPYEVFLTIEAAGWKGVSGEKTAIALSADTCAFYREVLRSFGESQQAVINTLELGGSPAAGQMGLRVNDTLFLLKIGFDERFRDHGPGGMLLLQTAEHEAARGTIEMNLVTHPPWVNRWHLMQEMTYSLTTFNASIYGIFLQLLHAGYQRLHHYRVRYLAARGLIRNLARRNINRTHDTNRTQNTNQTQNTCETKNKGSE